MAPRGKTKAVLSYLTPLGLLIAISMNKDENDEFALWHIKNMTGLSMLLFVSFAMSYQEYLILPGSILFYGSIIFWVYSLIMAMANKKSGIPYLSGKFQKWFIFLD